MYKTLHVCDFCGKNVSNSGYYHGEHKNNFTLDNPKPGYASFTTDSYKSFDICDDCYHKFWLAYLDSRTKQLG